MVIDKDVMVSGVCSSIKTLCDDLCAALTSHITENGASDFVTKSYGGSDIDPVVIMNSRIVNCLENLQAPDADFSAIESELIKLLIMKRSGLHLSKALMEVTEEKERLAAEQEQNAKLVKKIVADPEVKVRRQRRKKTASDVFVDSGTFNYLDVDTVSDDNQCTLVVDDPFTEIKAKETDVVAPAPAPQTMEEFLQAEKLKALQALSDDNSI